MAMMTKLPNVDQIREFIPECTEIMACPELGSCVEKSNRLCNDKDRPCYMTFRREEIEGVILLDFKNNLIAVHKYNEEGDYARIVTPDGIDIKMDGKEPKEKIKKILKSIR